MVNVWKTILHLSFVFQAITWTILTVKVLNSYRKNKNFVSVLIGIAFIMGIILSIFSPLNIEQPEIYSRYFDVAIMFYTAGLGTIVFYVLDWKYLILAPFTITIIASLQYFIDYNAYDMNVTAFNFSMGWLPLVGFFYLAFKNKDGKSLSMGMQLIFIIYGGIMANTNYMLAAILTIISSIILLIGFSGGFDRVFKRKEEPVETGEILEKEISTA